MSYLFKNIANVFTLFRIFLAPIFFILFINKFYLYSFISFFVASITDILDGFLARRCNIVSNFGKFYDPLADKILIFFAFICISIYPPFIFSKYPMNDWAFILLYLPIIILILRDFLITVLRNKLEKKNILLKANFSGKMKTTFQLIFIHIYLLEFLLMDLNIDTTDFIFGIVKIDIAIPIISGFSFLCFQFLAILFSIISGMQYFFKSQKIIF